MRGREDRAQLHTIEALTASLIIVLALAVVVEATSVTPLSSSFTSQHIKVELQNTGNDVLATLDETPVTEAPGSPSLLKESLVEWAVFTHYDTYSWNNTSFVSVAQANRSALRTPLSDALSYALINQGIIFNVEVSYDDQSGNVRTSKMIWNGDPSENSAVVTRLVALHDGADEIPDGDLYDSNSILPDISPATPLHNVAEVRVTMWVM